jgi:hypothetical protein
MILSNKSFKKYYISWFYLFNREQKDFLHTYVYICQIHTCSFQPFSPLSPDGDASIVFLYRVLVAFPFILCTCTVVLAIQDRHSARGSPPPCSPSPPHTPPSPLTSSSPFRYLLTTTLHPFPCANIVSSAFQPSYFFLVCVLFPVPEALLCSATYPLFPLNLRPLYQDRCCPSVLCPLLFTRVLYAKTVSTAVLPHIFVSLLRPFSYTCAKTVSSDDSPKSWAKSVSYPLI